MKNTVIINLFAGPGAGKSTAAAYIFSMLKMEGLDCEYVSEFAKDKVWENNEEVFKCQFYIAGKQIFKISRCYGKVDVIITDSPILLSAIYNTSEDTFFEGAILSKFQSYKNKNYFISRNPEYYSENGRNETLPEAIEVDKKLKKYLEENSIYYTMIPGEKSGYDLIVKEILSEIPKEDKSQSGLKTYPTIEDLINSKSFKDLSEEERKIVEPKYTPDQLRGMGIHFICGRGRGNVSMYYCQYVCKQCQREKEEKCPDEFIENSPGTSPENIKY